MPTMPTMPTMSTKSTMSTNNLINFCQIVNNKNKCNLTCEKIQKLLAEGDLADLKKKFNKQSTSESTSESSNDGCDVGYTLSSDNCTCTSNYGGSPMVSSYC